MSLGWRFCVKCKDYREWPELITHFSTLLRCGHDADHDTDIINHKDYNTTLDYLRSKND